MNRIVVGVDGSSAATAAARWAAREAAMRDTGLIIVHAVAPALGAWPQTAWPAIPLPAEFGTDGLARGEKILNDTLAVIAKTTGPRQPWRITTRLRVGTVVPTVCEFARDAADMVVVGRRARGGIDRTLLGSVSSAVVHSAGCPVAVIHHDQLARGESIPAPVVVGIDGSPTSEWATAVAFDEASRRAVELAAVHATDHAATSESADLLAQALAGYRQRYPDVVVRSVITAAHPADAPLDQSQRANVVVLGSRGHAGRTGRLLGSVSAAVVQASRTPVIVGRRHVGPVSATDGAAQSLVVSIEPAGPPRCQ
jgi:nucleotide-binding universal stress UspA family protein